MTVNRTYKDSVFYRLFNNKPALRELYSALSGTPLTPSDPVVINTLEGVLFNGLRNDISCEIDGQNLVLLEHQSTVNPNMPLRFLLYIAHVYEKIVDNQNIYAGKPIPILRPEFYVFYIGTDPYPDTQVLKLSDLFVGSAAPPHLELSVNVFNINKGHSKALLDKCPTLAEYSEFVHQVREVEKVTKPREEAMRLAIKYCVDHNVLKDFLEAEASEVTNMLLNEWDMDKALAVRREEGWSEGWEKGIAVGEERGWEKGRSEGWEKGVAVGEEKGREDILALINQGWSAERLKDFLAKKDIT